MTTNAKIKKLIDDNEVLLFMKGNPTFPQCGFSSVACQALGCTRYLHLKRLMFCKIQRLGKA